VVAAQPRELIADGHLVPCEVIAPKEPTRSLSMHPVDAWRAYGGGRAIVYCRDVKHAQKVAEEFTAAAIPSASVEGTLDDDERARRLAAHRAGALTVLTNVQILTEGYDDPHVSMAIMARSFSTAGSWIQAIGRIVRPSPGKTKATVVDLRGSVYKWGLPDEDRVYSLEGKAISSGTATEEGIRQCRSCQRIFRASEYKDATCPACGARCPGKPDPAVRRAAMAKVLSAHTGEDKRRKWGELIATQRARGYRPGWAAIRFKVMYGHYPGYGVK
jgi:superfamily II DNA or RNA helicase